MASETVTIRANTLLFRGWLRLVWLLAMIRVVPADKGMELAERGKWLVLIRVGRSWWKWLR